MGEMSNLKHLIEKIHHHHEKNGVPLKSAIQTVADKSKYTFDELEREYELYYHE